MVRKMNCPFCGNSVSVSSHWETAMCGSCHQRFEIGVEIFELSDAEQEKATKIAQEKIKEEEARRAERAAETKRRLRKAVHLPEEDPYAHVQFEDDEKPSKNEPETDSVDKKKKFIIIGGAVAVCALIFIILGSVLISAASKGKKNAEAPKQSPQTVTQQVKEDSGDVSATKEENDGSWVDGYGIDSNHEDGKYKIDLQSGEAGEQRDVQLRPDVVDIRPSSAEIEDRSAGDNDVQVEQTSGAEQETETQLPDDAKVSDIAEDSTGLYSTSGNVEEGVSPNPEKTGNDAKAAEVLLQGTF